MSYADGRRIIDLEAAVAALLARVAALEEMVADTRAFCEARLMAGTPTGATGGLERIPPTQRPCRAPADDPVMAGVVGALKAGRSIRAAADMLGLDRNKVDRLRRRAIAAGSLSRPDLRHDRALPP